MPRIELAGRFQNRSELVLHTHDAVKLCEGGKTDTNGDVHKIPGLFVFGILLNNIWNAVKSDDPYAEMTLIEIERLLDRAFVSLQKLDQRLERYRQQSKLPEGVILEINESRKASHLTLDGAAFHATHTRLLVILIATYDALIRKLLTCGAFGMINNKTRKQLLYLATKAVRSVLMSPTPYKKTGVTRNDILLKNERGQEALQKYGMVPLAILNREEHSRFGPLTHANQHDAS